MAVLDPMAVVPAGLVRSAGVRRASGVMALDAIANWIVNWPQLHRGPQSGKEGSTREGTLPA
ncbi:hypothetical protein [Streptomyces platensis]|uniref:hypothetical protein n=1 Tax=Streptomyces platensis TaxID=58346 RepID=UPI0031EB0BAC